MNATKHFAVAALLVLGATLSAGTPARAQTFDLTPTGAESGATGQATLARVQYLGYYADGWSWQGYYWVWNYYRGSLSVKCQGLTPGATYATSAGTFKAARDGTGWAKTNRFDFAFEWDKYWQWGSWTLVYAPEVEVSRINPDGSLTPVLSVTLPAPLGPLFY